MNLVSGVADKVFVMVLVRAHRVKAIGAIAIAKFLVCVVVQIRHMRAHHELLGLRSINLRGWFCPRACNLGVDLGRVLPLLQSPHLIKLEEFLECLGRQ